MTDGDASARPSVPESKITFQIPGTESTSGYFVGTRLVRTRIDGSSKKAETQEDTGHRSRIGVFDFASDPPPRVSRGIRGGSCPEQRLGRIQAVPDFLFFHSTQRHSIQDYLPGRKTGRRIHGICRHELSYARYRHEPVRIGGHPDLKLFDGRRPIDRNSRAGTLLRLRRGERRSERRMTGARGLIRWTRGSRQ